MEGHEMIHFLHFGAMPFRSRDASRWGGIDKGLENGALEVLMKVGARAIKAVAFHCKSHGPGHGFGRGPVMAPRAGPRRP